jgi:hypothetical protein
MSWTDRTPPRGRPRRPVALPALAVAGVAIVGALGYQSLGPSLSSTPSSTTAPSAAASSIAQVSPGLVPPLGERGDPSDEIGLSDGAVPDGVTVFDDEVPAVAKLDAALLAAIRRATSDAESDGVELYVNSGWRSRAYQEQLLRKAISEYGSAEQAARWVSSPKTSSHVSGDAIDIGGAGATTWLSRHGVGYGLCQIYDNEPWHFELRPHAVDRGCPRRYADPTKDPRMQP